MVVEATLILYVITLYLLYSNNTLIFEEYMYVPNMNILTKHIATIYFLCMKTLFLQIKHTMPLQKLTSKEMKL